MMNSNDKKLIEPNFRDEKMEAALTRFPSPISDCTLSDADKISFIAKRFSEIMEVLGLNLEDPSLAKTPQRVAKMYVKEIFSGMKKENFPDITYMPNVYSKNARSNMVFLRVHFTSFCEHHFVPFVGFAHVAYFPKEKLIGLSKISRIVKYFAKRPQIQERLTAQIADSLRTILGTEDVALSITAVHFCVAARGIEDQNGQTTTNDFGGRFEEMKRERQEFFEAIKQCQN